MPANCKFEVEDAEQPFARPTDHFDFVHVRNLAQGITDWPAFVAQIFR